MEWTDILYIYQVIRNKLLLKIELKNSGQALTVILWHLGPLGTKRFSESRLSASESN